MEESKHCYVDVDVLFQRRRKTEMKRKKIFGEGEYLFFWRRRKIEKKRGKYLEKISPKRILRSLGFSLGLETFANFWRVSASVSENLVSEKSPSFHHGVSQQVYFWMS